MLIRPCQLLTNLAHHRLRGYWTARTLSPKESQHLLGDKIDSADEEMMESDKQGLIQCTFSHFSLKAAFVKSVGAPTVS